MSGSGEPPARPSRETAHVIVCGNEKGGSGKSTTAVHLAIALLKMGHRVATVDLDGRQLSMTRYLENRRRWAAASGNQLEIPQHFHVPPVRRNSVGEAERSEFKALMEGLAEIEYRHDFIVIDTPGSDTYLNRLAHRICDTLVTPLNDSLVDFDVLARVDAVSNEVIEISQYAESVRDARRERRNADNAMLDWVVVRNRMAFINSRNETKVDACLRKLSAQLGFRISDGISERVIFREFFPVGLTALDELEDRVLGTRPTLSHLAARQEIRRLVQTLRLPIGEDGRRRADVRRQFMEKADVPIALPDIFAD
ncbi:ATPase [Zhengella mangrovi]|uniref:ATPase n=1 Tax=Zhengella mangrovi TaxID=1982044 RepID=A0A2G1QHU4_9HYPH|nr:division plane positioning ATPase MipZ [Zhengella mangrovi]PHP65093.1 ATPase [Zhengella mangrovi]